MKKSDGITGAGAGEGVAVCFSNDMTLILFSSSSFFAIFNGMFDFLQVIRHLLSHMVSIVDKSQNISNLSCFSRSLWSSFQKKYEKVLVWSEKMIDCVCSNYIHQFSKKKQKQNSIVLYMDKCIYGFEFMWLGYV